MSRKKANKIEKPENALITLKRLFAYTKGLRLALTVVIIGIILTAVAKIVGTAFLKIIVDKYIEPLIKDYNIEIFNGFINTLLLIGVIYFTGVMASYIYSRILISISAKALYNIRCDLFSKMEKLPIKYFDTHTHGELMSLYTNDVDAIREMMTESFPSFILSIISIVGIFSMMVYYSWQLTCIVMIAILFMFFLARNITKKSGSYFVKQQNELGKVNGFVEEMIEGQKVVKVFCHENKTIDDFNIINNELYDISSKANGYANVLMPTMVNLSNINYAIISISGSIFILLNILTLGTLVAFLQYTRMFVHPISDISQQFNSVLTALAGAERIFKVMDARPEKDDGKVVLANIKIDESGNIIETNERTGIWAWKSFDKDGNAKYIELKGEIEFKDVVFSYNDEKIVLNTINLKANMGEKIAFVGSTGAGKTTITNLINRFYDIKSGEITFDGINIKNIKKVDLRKTISIVLQDTHLFTDTVRENIRYGKLNATDDEVIEAAKLANAHEFISHLPKGYDTILTTDGQNLSQGERQLLAIARAIVADPPVLILDEATSSIDTRTEKLIEQGMDTLMNGRTVFIIAHRLSTVRDSDTIIVLENGTIIEQGNHEKLLDNKGKYYQLYNGMFELE